MKQPNFKFPSIYSDNYEYKTALSSGPIGKPKKKNNSGLEQITISVSNNELNALEELLTVKLSEKDYEERRKACITLWGKLVKEFDKPKSETKYIYEYLVPYSFNGRVGRVIVERDQEISSLEDIGQIENDLEKDKGGVEVVVTNFILLNKKEQSKL